MKIKNLALALMLGAAVAACSQNQQSTAEKDAAAQQAADAQQKLQDAEKAAADAQAAADQAKKDAAAAEKRADRAERRSEAPRAPTPVAVCDNCGTVTAITATKQKPDGSGAGAVLGAAAGGVAGHQVGGGRGKDVATVLGALAGAYAGNQAEKSIRAETVYQIDVRMDNGGSRTITVKDAGNLAVGSKVRVNGDVIEPRG